MFRSLSRSALSILLWLLLVCLLAFSGYIALKACGIRIFGVEIAWCTRDPLPDVSRINELYRQVQSLERLKAEPDFCPPASFRSANRPAPAPTVTPPTSLISPSAPTSPSATPAVVAPAGPAAVDGVPVPTNPAEAGKAAPAANPALKSAIPEPEAPKGPPANTSQETPPGKADENPPKAGTATADPNAKGLGMPLPKPSPLKGGPGSPGAGNPPPGSPSTPPPGTPKGPPPPSAPSAPPPGSPPATAGKPNNPDQCPEGKSSDPYIVLALDHSRSMALPENMDDALATRLEGQMEKGGSAGWNARRLYNGYVEQEGRKRLDVLKDSVAALSEKIDPKIEFGVVSFAGCGGVVDMGNYDARRRPRLVEKVRALQAKPATPAAIALRTAMTKASEKPGGRVIFVSDGKDTCDADPCAIAKAQPGVRVDVISMGGGDVLACVAEATSGNIYQAGSHGSLENLLLALGNQ